MVAWESDGWDWGDEVRAGTGGGGERGEGGGRGAWEGEEEVEAVDVGGVSASAHNRACVSARRVRPNEADPGELPRTHSFRSTISVPESNKSPNQTTASTPPPPLPLLLVTAFQLFLAYKSVILTPSQRRTQLREG